MNGFDKSVKKKQDAQQDVDAKAETSQDYAEGKPSSETPDKAKNKVKDALP